MKKTKRVLRIPAETAAPPIAGHRRHSGIQATVSALLRRGIPASLFATTLIGSGVARSQEKLEEIIVSAQKREESVMNVPASISVVGAGELEQLRVQKLDDFIYEIPNANFGRYTAWSSDVNLRGIGSGAVGGQFAGVAVTIDESSFGATNMGEILQAQFLDVERVEVLRGPQGTMSGANAIGGQINMITQKPTTDKTEVKGTFDIGRFGKRFGKGVVNLPLSDTLAMRAVAYVDKLDGAVKNIGPSGGSSGADSAGGRVALRWTPFEQLTLDGTIAYEHQQLGLTTRLPVDVFPDGVSRADQIQAVADRGGNYFDSDFLTDDGMNGGNVRFDAPVFAHITDALASFRAQYDLDTYKLDLIYGHFNYGANIFDDVDQSEFRIYEESVKRHASADSAELRITSKYQGDFNWIAGTSWVHDKHRTDYVDWESDGFPDSQYQQTFASTLPQEIKSFGVFANTFWNLTPRLHLSAGARWSRYTTNHANVQTFPEIDQEALLTPAATLSEWSPRVTMTYNITDDVNAYASYSTGYRAGYGNNPRAINAGFADVEVHPERVKNYEVGTKGQFLDDHLRLSAAAFYMEYTDLQVFTYAYQIATDEFFYWDVNAGSAFSRGFELEAAARVAGGLELRANVGYLDSNINGIPQGEGEPTLDHVPLPGAAPWTVSLGATYSRPLSDELEASLRVNYTWQDTVHNSLLPDPAFAAPAWNKVDLDLGVSGKSWTASLYAENIFDHVYWTGQYNAYYSPRGTYMNFDPRTFGLRMTYTWDK